jgi:Right handed beta helix region
VRSFALSPNAAYFVNHTNVGIRGRSSGARVASRLLTRLAAVGVAVAAATLVMAHPALAASTVHVATTGDDIAGCGAAAAPCQTIAFGYSEAVPGDTIMIAAGTYVMSTPLVVSKANLTFQGAQAGVDARARTPGGAGETDITSGLTGTQARDLWVVQANAVTIDGFTFANNPVGAGVSTSENFSGYRVQNTVFVNNLKGFAPSSNGTQPSVFTRNLYATNNNGTVAPGTQGNGVFTFRPLANASFTDSKFEGNANAPINLAGNEVVGGTHDVTITGNQMDGEFGVTLVSVSNVTVSGNHMVGGWNGVQVSGRCHHIVITGNLITDKTRGAVLLFAGFAAFTNTDITIANNDIERTATVPTRSGIEISRSTGVSIHDNLIADSGEDAIGFTTRGQAVPSGTTEILRNSIIGTGAPRSGIDIAAGAYEGPLTVHFNRIVDNNGRNGVVNNEPAATVDARWNWWGCNSMPAGAGCDHIAGAAADTVTFSPWLVLHLSASPADIPAGSAATLVATLRMDSSGAQLSGPFFHTGIAFFSATVGHVAPPEVRLDALVTAATGWPAGQPRPQDLCVTVDHETICLVFPANGGPGEEEEFPAPPPPVAPGLPPTGSAQLSLIVAGLGLCALGALVVGAARLRRRASHA